MKRRAIATLTLILGTVPIGTGLIGAGLAEADEGTHWDYSGARGPEHWGEIDPHFIACRSGQAQTPIDIASRIDADLPRIGFHYRPGGHDEVHNGHTIQVDYDAGSTITLDGRDYSLKQFHFHTPSENHVDGKTFPMEAHLVHADTEGHLAVIAVMFEEGPENLALSTPWAAMPRLQGRTAHLGTKASAEALLPADRAYYRFEGSLTTPPCTEGVTWLVMKHPVSASHGQLVKFARAMGHPNNRPIQPLNARVVFE
ncbi:carbonic anhydrase [Thiocapsa rosea]|uniref:Carbonic anhydrase n=1 Tax=Thiocapsa rosea TaxID=69360 RepID=A0A495VEY8_9GAMM|nr:carbonic anhydrase [Thiocapsa rosea]RKT46967.1 carbonic anhydrase [Thiocapsa rosea]